jgi:hypothetical protein
MLTVGQINEKISTLRSKIAVTQGLVLYLKSHYMPSDGTTAEMHFTRSDYGKVPPDHVEATIADYVDYLDTLKIELEKWENTPISTPEPSKLTPGQEPVPPPAPAPEQKPVAKANGGQPAPAKPATRKEALHAAQRSGQDQPAARQPAPAGKPG